MQPEVIDLCTPPASPNGQLDAHTNENAAPMAKEKTLGKRKAGPMPASNAVSLLDSDDDDAQ